MDRCETDDCVPVIELGPDGKTLKNFGAGLFVEPHQVAIDKDGNVWVADAGAKGAKGFQVTKFSPDGRVLLKLGKPGQGAPKDQTDSAVDFDLQGTGPADVFTRGHHYKATWDLSNPELPLKIVGADSKVMPLPSGLTWVHLVDPGTAITAS